VVKAPQILLWEDTFVNTGIKHDGWDIIVMEMCP